MTDRCIVGAAAATFVLTSALSVSAQVPSAGDMQQKLDQEMAKARRSANESSSSAQQGGSNVTSEAEKKMEDIANEQKSQAEGKMTEQIEKAKRKAQGMGR